MYPYRHKWHRRTEGEEHATLGGLFATHAKQRLSNSEQRPAISFVLVLTLFHYLSHPLPLPAPPARNIFGKHFEAR